MSAYDGIRQDFPVLERTVGGHALAYLDNAATLPMPKPVLDELSAFRSTGYANVHRGAHALSEETSALFDEARRIVASFIGGDEQELAFAAGTTDALNKAALMLAPRLDANANIVITQMEHHSNILPWRQAARTSGCALRVAPIDGTGALDTAAFESLVDEETAVVCLTQLSNVTGIAADCARLLDIVRERSGAVVVVDGAQGIVHLPTDVRALGCDMYAFSGHKLGALTGIGALWTRRGLLDTLEPAAFGGGTVAEVNADGALLVDSIERFEAGTPPIDGALSLAAAVRYWHGRNPAACRRHEHRLLARLEAGLADIEAVRVLGSAPARIGCLSFAVEAGSPFDWAKLLDGFGIAVRSGYHCAQPYLEALGCTGAVRVAVAPFNTEEEIDRTLEALARIASILKGGAGRGRSRDRGRHLG